MMSQTYQFKTPSVIVNGPGAAKELGSFARAAGKKLCGNRCDIGKNRPARCYQEFPGGGWNLFHRFYDQVLTEPTVDHTEAGLKIYKDPRPISWWLLEGKPH